MIITILFIIIALLYFALHLYLYKGLKISMNLKGNEKSFPFISVIVAARNESDNIARCLNSLKAVNYPSDKFEVIFVNDRSTDNTREIIEKSIQGRNNFRVIDSDEHHNEKLKGKINALNSGISVSKGELILMTDADCTVNKNWLRHYAKYYSPDTPMICGFTMIIPFNLFGKLQSLDWMYLQGLASASSGINMQMSCIGNNLSISRKAYSETGGYPGIRYSVTEDLSLMQSVQKQNKGRILYPLTPGDYAATLPCKDIHELTRQKKRWFRGGLKINSLGYISGFLMYVINLFLLTGFIIAPTGIYLLLIALKFISDWIIIYPVAEKFKMKNILWNFILFEIYFMIYGLLLPFTFITGKEINWKERKL